MTDFLQQKNSTTRSTDIESFELSAITKPSHTRRLSLFILVFRRLHPELFSHFALIRPADVVRRDLGEFVGYLVVVWDAGIDIVGGIHYLVGQVRADIRYQIIRGAAVVAESIRLVEVRRAKSVQYLMRIRSRVLHAVYAVAVDPAELIGIGKAFVADDRAGILVVSGRCVNEQNVYNAVCPELSLDIVDGGDVGSDVLPYFLDALCTGVVEDLVGHFRLVVEFGVDSPVALEVDELVPGVGLGLYPACGELKEAQGLRYGHLVVRVGKVPGICRSGHVYRYYGNDPLAAVGRTVRKLGRSSNFGGDASF